MEMVSPDLDCCDWIGDVCDLHYRLFYLFKMFLPFCDVQYYLRVSHHFVQDLLPFIHDSHFSAR